MELRSLSASSAAMFEDCPARWNAEYHGRAEQIGSVPALKGTVVHATLEAWVRSGRHRDPGERPQADIELYYANEYEKLFSDTEEYDDGLEMVLKWLERTDWSGREVLDLEVKKSFPVFPLGESGPKASDIAIPFNYIFDRVDRLEGPEGEIEIEVVDYKTWRTPVSGDALRHKVQAKAYALAASKEYPEATAVWVTMDQLRFEPISVKFKKRDLEEFEAYLERLAARILEMDADEAPEVLNHDCRYCVRKLNCRALATNAQAGGTLGNLDNIAEAAILRSKIKDRVAGLETLLEEIDAFIAHDMERNDLTETVLPLPDGEVHVEMELSKRRNVSAERAAKILGPDMVAKYAGSVPMKVVDALLKKDNHEITDEQKRELQNIIQTRWGTEAKPKITVVRES